MGEFVGKRVVPDHVGVWDQKKTYEPLMIVLDGETGDSYISRKAVPVGISLADESYWSLCAHYSAQMRKLEQDVDVDVQQMHSDVTAVKNAMSQEFQETHTAISKELDDTHKAISQELSETEQRVNENLEQTSSELTGKVEQAKSDLNTGRQELKDAKDKLKARYAALRKNVLSEANVQMTVANFLVDIPKGLLDQEVVLWPKIPGTNTNNMSQILNWYRLRCIAMDAEMNAL